MHYYSLRFFFEQEFGCRVRKISVDAGFSCPNVDGTLGRGGCVFCNLHSFSPSRRGGVRSVSEQIEEGTRRLRARYGTERFIAYFQPATNTYAPLDRLRTIYEEAVSHPAIVGVSIGTRPDCVPDLVLDLLAELSGRTWLLVEFGVQTIHDRSLAWMNRGHGHQASLDALTRSRQRGLRVGAHVILGLPGESHEDMAATARELARLRVHSLKIHNLCAVRGTPLVEEVASGRTALPALDAYAGYVVDFLECLAPECVIDRLCADAPPEYLVGPSWCLNKPAALAAIQAEFQRRATWQGRLWRV